MVNVTEFHKLIDYLNAHRSQVNMEDWMIIDPNDVSDVGELNDTWRCNTVACAAGWTVINAGWQPHPGEVLDDAIVHVTKDGITNEVFVVASEILDLDEDQAVDLFIECTDVVEAIEYIRSVLLEPQLTI